MTSPIASTCLRILGKNTAATELLTFTRASLALSEFEYKPLSLITEDRLRMLDAIRPNTLCIGSH